jgi:RNA polymerase-binding protein DksA
MRPVNAKNKLKQLSDQLRARRAELADRLASLDSDARRASEPLVADFAEQAVQRENDDVVDRLRENTRVELREIGRALGRVADGTYGTCVRCGQPIEAARLEAMPATSDCVSCKAKDHGA